MKAPHSLHMGPAPAAAPTATATKFWNVASVSEDEGEITLYGDVMSQQPIDWWTGEPEPGLYITPEGFMEDLAAVKDKAHITVKLNSCGGDLYTGIAIHNALKALSGDVNVVVEGIAASAASVIMCAGDTVTVYPGSLIMIHGVSVMLWDSLNIQDMKQLIKGMDASERAVAERRKDRARRRYFAQHDDKRNVDDRAGSSRQGLRGRLKGGRGRTGHEHELRSESPLRQRCKPQH